MIADVNGVHLAYSDTRAGAPVLLMVHGFGLNRAMWDPQLGSLRSAGARVIAPDLRGFGASEAGAPGPLSMDQHADDLACLLDALNVKEKIIYVGLSMGGYVGFSFWRRHAERVRAFVLADTRASADSPDGRQRRLAMARDAEASNSPQPAIDGMLPLFFSPQLRPGSPPEHLARGMLATTPVRGIADGQRGMASRLDSLASLPGITVPSLVIVGEHDLLTVPDEARQMAELLPDARLVTIDQAGHLSNLENPDAFNTALLAFIDELAGKKR